MCPNLRVLAVEGINCRLSSQSMSELSSLNHVRLYNSSLNIPYIYNNFFCLFEHAVRETVLSG